MTRMRSPPQLFVSLFTAALYALASERFIPPSGDVPTWHPAVAHFAVRMGWTSALKDTVAVTPSHAAEVPVDVEPPVVSAEVLASVPPVVAVASPSEPPAPPEPSSSPHAATNEAATRHDARRRKKGRFMTTAMSLPGSSFDAAGLFLMALF